MKSAGSWAKPNRSTIAKTAAGAAPAALASANIAEAAAQSTEQQPCGIGFPWRAVVPRLRDGGGSRWVHWQDAYDTKKKGRYFYRPFEQIDCAFTRSSSGDARQKATRHQRLPAQMLKAPGRAEHCRAVRRRHDRDCQHLRPQSPACRSRA
jgi:hypothetical protein